MRRNGKKGLSAAGKKPGAIRSKLFLAMIGLCAGLAVCEISLCVYNRWLAWLPYGNPPPYQVGNSGIRLAVLGGSTSNGGPYSDAQTLLRNKFRRSLPEGVEGNFNLLTVTQYFLKNRYGYSKVEVDAYTYGGWPLEWTVKDYWQNAETKPDVLVLYTGQNEWASYYSCNMRPPPRAVSFLGHLNTGSLILRYLFMRQARDDDLVDYNGGFLNREVIPWYEASFNRKRYVRYIETLIRHCRQESIFLIVVIPEGNHLYPPARSVYRGPADRRDEAISLFKQAFRLKYFEQNLDGAKALFEQLDGFCGFTDLYYELGDIYYRQGNFEKAREYLCAARDAAGIPTTVTSDYRDLLRELAGKHDVPAIDMHELIVEQMGATVPDFSVFVDDCHLKPQVYEELSREIIRVLRENRCPKLDLPEKTLKLSHEEWIKGVGLTDEVVAVGVVEANRYIATQSNNTFLKLPGLETCLRYFPAIGKDQKVAAQITATRMPDLKKRIREERERLRVWVG
ncbi:MAG: hypothetical protein QGI24_08845, partial [Kiritimatiellia bacterium]|nr:hypothetical protein [Kiritimatiellia bacterium]